MYSDGHRDSHYNNNSQNNYHERLKGLLINLGNDLDLLSNSALSDYRRSLDGVAIVITQRFNEFGNGLKSSADSHLNRLIINCITDLPSKLPIYANFIAWLNGKPQINHVIPFLIDDISDEINKCFAAANFRNIKQLLRFFGELVQNNVVSSKSFINLILSMIQGMQGRGFRQELLDAVLFVVLASLPWSAAKLNENAPEEFPQFLASVESRLAERNQAVESGLGLVFEALKVYRDGDPQTPYPQVDRLSYLWEQLKELTSRDWQTSIIYRPLQELGLTLTPGPMHDVKTLEIPTQIRYLNIPAEDPVFWVFDDTVNTPEKILVNLPPTITIERFILDELAVDTIYNLSHNHIACSEVLLSLPRFLNTSGWTASHASSNEGNANSPYQAIVENLIRELIKLPDSQEKSIYYSTLLADLCRGAPDKVPSALGRALRVVFARMDDGGGVFGGMDMECIRRFGEWFAHHLSNFDFKWRWADWTWALEDTSTAKFAFIRETLEREVRLSYYDRIKGTLPQEFVNHGLVFLQQAPSFEFTYQNLGNFRDEGFIELVSRVQRSIVSKLDMESVSLALVTLFEHRTKLHAGQHLQNEGDTAEGMDAEVEDIIAKQPLGADWKYDGVVRDVFVQHVLHVGSKSFSHLLNALERYVAILKILNERQQDQEHTVLIAFKFWQGNAQMLEITLDKLVNYRILDPTAIVNFILSDDVLDSYADRWFVWTILRNALTKVNARVAQLRKRLDESRSATAMDTDSIAQNQFDSATREQREIYINMFKRFTEKLTSIQSNGVDAQWRWIAGNMRNVGRLFRSDLKTMAVTVESLAFTGNESAEILQIWREVRAVVDLIQ